MCLSTHYNQQALGYLHANLIFAKWLRFTLRRSLLSCIFHLLLIQLSLLSFSQVAVHGQSPDASQHAFHSRPRPQAWPDGQQLIGFPF